MNTSIHLENDFVRLIPLQLSHTDALWEIAKYVDIFMFGPNDASSKQKLTTYIKQALVLKEEKKAIPFSIIDKKTGKIIGSTRFGNIDPKNKVVHIGWTWIAMNAQGTGINSQMKFLMLQYAFELLKFEKVEFRVDERNIKSRKAVEKLGAKLEGILRKTTYTKNGFKRNTCCYGILQEEWNLVKETNFKNYSFSSAGSSSI